VGLRLLLLAGQGVPGLTAADGESRARAWLLLHPGNQAPGSRGAAQQRGLSRGFEEGLERLHHPARATGVSQANAGCLGWGAAPCWGVGLGANQNWRLTVRLQVKMAACASLRAPQNREARERGEGGGVGKKRERKEKKKEGGKRQENPNSHPGRDLKGQRQLSAPPSRTPKTSLLSSPHWHLSAAQTHTQEPLLRVRSGLRPCLPRGSTEGRRARGSGRGRILLSPTALCPCKAQHRPTRAPAPAIPAGCPRRDRATRPPLTQLPTTQMSSVAV